MVVLASPGSAFATLAVVVRVNRPNLRPPAPAVQATADAAAGLPAFYLTCIMFVFGVLGVLLRAAAGVFDLQAGALSGPRVPADRRDFVVGVGVA